MKNKEFFSALIIVTVFALVIFVPKEKTHIAEKNLSIMDIAPLVLNEFNIEIPTDMDGSVDVRVQ